MTLPDPSTSMNRQVWVASMERSILASRECPDDKLRIALLSVGEQILASAAGLTDAEFEQIYGGAYMTPPDPSTPALRAAWGICAPAVAAAAQDAVAYADAIIDLAFVAGISATDADERFSHYVATQPHGWYYYFQLFKAGDREVWDALRGDT